MTQQTTRRERIELFFNHWLDFETPGGGLPGSGDEPGGISGMPSMFRTPSVREFYRCLVLHRSVAPVQHWHLAAFYKCEWRQTRKPVGKVFDKATRSWKPTFGPWERERIVPKQVRLEKVRRGVEFVVEEWDRDIDPSLPSVLLKVA